MTTANAPSRKPSYVPAFLLAALPMTASVTVLLVTSTFWMALAAGIGVGVLIGGLWALSVRSAALLILVPLPAIVTPACSSELGPDLTVLLTGTTKLTVAQAGTADVDRAETIEIADGASRLDHLVIYSKELSNTRPGMSHRTMFFAPLGPATGAMPTPATVWLACHRSVAVSSSEEECRRLLLAKPILARSQTSWQAELRSVVAKTGLETGPNPRVYEVQESPLGEALSNLAFVALLMVLNFASCFYLVFAARRAARS